MYATSWSGFPRWLSGKESACQWRRPRRHRFDLWVGKTPGGGNGNPLQYLAIQGQRNKVAVGHSPQARRDSNTTEHTHTGASTVQLLENNEGILYKLV